MPYRRHAPLKLVLGRALLLVALPLGACATGVEPELEDQPLLSDDAGSGGALASQGGSSAGTASPAAKAGSSSVSGSSANPFGGSASAGGSGKAGSNAGGSSGAGASSGAGSSGGSKAGAGGNAGSSSAGAGGDGCACPKTLTWTDNTVMSWAPGDCVTAGTTTYLYIGTKAQTYANGQCNPSKQEPWCPDAGNDYKFMACP